MRPVLAFELIELLQEGNPDQFGSRLCMKTYFHIFIR